MLKMMIKMLALMASNEFLVSYLSEKVNAYVASESKEDKKNLMIPIIAAALLLLGKHQNLGNTQMLVAFEEISRKNNEHMKLHPEIAVENAEDVLSGVSEMFQDSENDLGTSDDSYTAEIEAHEQDCDDCPSKGDCSIEEAVRKVRAKKAANKTVDITVEDAVVPSMVVAEA